MDASSKDTNSNQMNMGRPSEETLQREEDDCNLKDLVVSSEFGSPESRSGPSFHILDRLLEHEAERLRPIHISLSESSNALTVRADVPGVKEEDLRIKVQPDRVTISRKPAIARRFGTGLSVSCPDETSRVIELPSPVTVIKVRIAVKDGVLELDLEKASAGAAPQRTQGGETCAN